MLQPTTKVCILVCLGIFYSIICLAECGRGPFDEVDKPVDYAACSSVKGSYRSLQSTYPSYFSLDHGPGHQKTVPVTADVCSSSELFYFPSSLYGFGSEAQCSRMGNFDVNRSESGSVLPKRSTRRDNNANWSSDDVMFRLPDGGTVTCSLNFRELGKEKSPPSVNIADKIVLSSCRGHLLYKETGFSLQNIEIEKTPSSSVSSSAHVNISPSKLDWGQNYLYHPSVALLRLKNTCNESVLEVYEPLSTDSQFYPFNFSEIVLGPGEITTMSFVFLPKWLGSSSAELVLQTSIGGFLVEAKGFAVESPHRLRPLVGLDVSSGRWLRRKLSLSNPFDETIHLEEVTAFVSVFGTSNSLFAEASCTKQNPQGSDGLSFSDANKMSNGETELLNSVIMAIRPLSNWLISPHRTESILEMAFSPDPQGKVLGAICMQLLRPVEGEKDTLMIPFEAGLDKTATWNDAAAPLSVSIEPVEPCDARATTVSVSVRNSALHLLKIVSISEVVDSKKLLQIEYLEGLLLFPDAVTQVALVTYESPNVSDFNLSCRLQILVNESISPLLEVPCQEIFGICLRQHKDSLHLPEHFDLSNRTGSLISNEESLLLIKKWRDPSTMSGLYLLDDHELLFPLVPVGGYYAKSITVKNPGQHPVMVQLILNSRNSMDNCKTYYEHLHPPSSNSFIHNDSTTPSRYGFSLVDSAVTEAFLHPHGTVSLGPILFHPSNRCEWKSLAFIRNNLSGVESLSLRGFGGSVSLVLLDGLDLVHRLEFNINLPFPLNLSHPDNTPSVNDASSGCRKPLSKKLFAVNAGDFPVKVKRIDVSGTECGLDGFVVHNCWGFSLEPGESVELEISYKSDFSRPVVRRELELILAAGILVIPMQASVPLNMLNHCRKSIFWARVKRCCISMVIAAALIGVLSRFIMPFESMDYLIKGEKRSIPVVRPKAKPSTVLRKPGHRKSITSTKTGHLKQREHEDPSMDLQTEVTSSSDTATNIDFSPPVHPKVIPVETATELAVAQPVSLTVRTHKNKRRRPRKRNALLEVASSQSGNSTPSSPMSPMTIISPRETCSVSPAKRQPEDSFSPEPVSPARIPENQSDNLFSIQQQAPVKKTGSKPMLLPSATFPGMSSSPLRQAIAPHARAPGPTIYPRAEEKVRSEEDKFTYDIWGNHLSGIHLTNRPNGSFAMISGAIGGHSDSFFLKGPQQTLVTNSQPRSVSSLCDEG